MSVKIRLLNLSLFFYFFSFQTGPLPTLGVLSSTKVVPIIPYLFFGMIGPHFFWAVFLTVPIWTPLALMLLFLQLSNFVSPLKNKFNTGININKSTAFARASWFVEYFLSKSLFIHVIGIPVTGKTHKVNTFSNIWHLKTLRKKSNINHTVYFTL